MPSASSENYCVVLQKPMILLRLLLRVGFYFFACYSEFLAVLFW